MDVDEKILDELLHFIYERQEVWYKRFVLKEPSPWTNNPILRKYKFCNIYPENDRGSRFIIEKTRLDNTRDKIFKIIVYRLFNNMDTYNTIENLLSVDKWDTNLAVDRLKDNKKKGIVVFGNAYMITGTGKFKTSHSKIEVVCKDVIRDNLIPLFDDLYSHIAHSGNLYSTHLFLQRIRMVANFSAYVMCQDLCRCGVVRFTMNDCYDPSWTPGARKAFKILCPNEPEEMTEDFVYWLRNNYQNEFKRRGLDFKHLDGKPLGLLECENSMCEFQKFWNIKVGTTKNARNRKFVPQKEI